MPSLSEQLADLSESLATMSGDENRNRPNPTAAAALARHVEAIERSIVDHSYAYDSAGLLTEKLEFMAANWSPT